MRIAVMVISLGVTLVVFVQSCAASAAGELGDDEETSGAGGAGLFVGLCYLLGGAFALAYPRASIIFFLVAATIAIPVGATTDFSDLLVWGIVALVLAFLSWRGYREKQRREAPATIQIETPPPAAE